MECVQRHFRRAVFGQGRCFGAVQRCVLRKPARLPGRLHAIEQNPAGPLGTIGKIEKHDSGVRITSPARRCLKLLIPGLIRNLEYACRLRERRAFGNRPSVRPQGLNQRSLRRRKGGAESEQEQRLAHRDRAGLQVLRQQLRKRRRFQPFACSPRFLKAPGPADETAFILSLDLGA